MKKYIYTLVLAVMLPWVIWAQSPANRIPKTVVADVLAQMPAKNVEIYNNMMRDLVASGQEGVTALVSMMQSPSLADNQAVEYAIGGLSNYVTAKGQESARKMVTEAYIKALNAATDRDIKAFFLFQLMITGENNVIETAKQYAVNPDLYNEAIRVLVAVNTPEAKQAIGELVEKIPSKAAAAKAVGDVKLTEAESLLLSWLDTATDLKEKKAILYALGAVGSEASLKPLNSAAAEADFQYEETEAVNAYVTLVCRLKDKKAAAKLLKNKLPHVRTAALEILVETEPDKAVSYIVSALSDDSRPFRNAALNAACTANIKEPVAQAIVVKLSKYPEETQTDIINWLGLNQYADAEKMIIPYVSSDNVELSEAAMYALVRIGNKEGLQAVVNGLNTTNTEKIAAAKKALLWSPLLSNELLLNQYSSELPEAAQCAIIELVSSRTGNDAWKDKVMTLCQSAFSSNSESVKEAAYKALVPIATKSQAKTLSDILKKAPDAYLEYVQQALGKATAQMGNDGFLFIDGLINQAPADKKYLYYAVLPYTGSKEALKLIASAMESSDATVKQAAVKTLTSWTSPDAIDLLYQAVQNPSVKDLHQAAVERYTQLVASSQAPSAQRLLQLRKMLDIVQTDEQKNILLQAIGNCPEFNSVIVAGAYLDNEKTRHTAGTAIMNVALKNKAINGPEIKAILQKVMDTRGGSDATYDKEAIKKHLNELAAEEGFVSMFNGKDLSGWKGLVANPIARAKMSAQELEKAQEKADEIMRSGWSVENGVLVFSGKGDNLCTEKQYGDFEMYVEWMLDPAGPEADAGIYLRGTPQVQIWDTARVNVGAQVGSGGLYNNQNNPSKPLKVADNKLGEWNAFYIKMVGDRVTVDLNGERVVDNVILENYWNRNLPIFPIEQIELQAHGSKCSFRNLYIKELKRQEPFQLSEQEKKEGFQILFDGTNMHEWQGNTVDYVLEDGCISMIPSSSFGGNLYTKKEYDNFIYRFEFQLTPGANNGVGLRTPMGVDAAYYGMESQILDCEHKIYEGITPYQHHGSIYGIIKANENHKKAIKPVGEWNEEEIICDGDNIKVTVNGVVIVEGNIRDAVKNGTPDGKEHPGLFNKKGYIGFLGHGSPVKFRNIRIKEL